jgi:alginate O-acetyltransferase complex protein AlgI
MTFVSLEYLAFLPIVFIAFYTVRIRWRLPVLLVASVWFYASLHAPYLMAVLLALTLQCYWFGLRIERSTQPGRKLAWLWMGILATSFWLLTFKYLPAARPSFDALLARGFAVLGAPPFPGVVTIGLAYSSLQATSYLVDVYLGTCPAVSRISELGLAFWFFPKLLQGPIERMGPLVEQFGAMDRPADYDRLRSALLLVGVGVAKKVVIADRLAVYVGAAYGDVRAYQGFALWAATYLFAVQIYFDFSGYTDIALGTARLFGLSLTQNFDRPYSATSMADFWRRWHMSFSNWLLDYVFKPLQISMRDWRRWGTPLALVITFVVSGIWHGAARTFLVWGAIHGIFLAVEVLWRPYQGRLYRALRLVPGSAFRKWWGRLVTFHIVCLAWVFFRAGSLGDAWYVLTHCWGHHDGIARLVLAGGYSAIAEVPVVVVVLAVAVWLKRQFDGRWQALWLRSSALRMLHYGAAVLFLALFGVFLNQGFVYGRF